MINHLARLALYVFQMAITFVVVIAFPVIIWAAIITALAK